MGLSMKIFGIIGVHKKIQFLGGKFMKNQYIGGNCQKRGLGENEGAWHPNAHYVYFSRCKY